MHWGNKGDSKAFAQGLSPRKMVPSMYAQSERMHPPGGGWTYPGGRLGSYGLVPIVAGLDKCANLLADWQAYLSPLTPTGTAFASGKMTDVPQPEHAAARATTVA